MDYSEWITFVNGVLVEYLYFFPSAELGYIIHLLFII